MDEPDVAVKRKGAVFTMDALFALALLLISILFLLVLLNRQPARPVGLEPAGDVMEVLRTLKLEELRGNPRYPYANQILESNITDRRNETVVESIADLFLSGHAEEAENLTREFLEAAIPADYGVELLVEKPGTNCDGNPSAFSCVYSAKRGQRKNFVGVDRHFIYYDNVTREVRLVVYK